MRLLGAVRLSRETDDTTSPERQREQIELTAQIRGDIVTHIAEDIDVSGAVDPFKREQLGPWLTDPNLIRQWDVIAVAKLDRLTRSLLDFVTFNEWCKQNNKTIVSVGEGIDFSNSMGTMFGNILIMFAQFERERMAERRKEAKTKLDQMGKWNGGTIPYGYKPAKASDGGWNLVPDEDGAAPIVRQMADEIIAGKSAQSVARSLHERGIPASQGGQWRQSAVVHILRSPVLKGYIVSNGQIVRGPDGMPVKRDPILTDENWDRVQATLDKATKTMPANREDASLLLRVAYCACGQPLYIQRKSNRKHAYYYCSTKTASHQPCPNNSWIRSELLETFVTETLLDAVGNIPHQEKIVKPAEDHSAELAEVNEAIANLMADRYERGLFSGSAGASRYTDMMSKLEARQMGLEALPSHDETVEWKPTGQTFGEYFTSLTDPQRRLFLLSSGIEVYLSRNDGPSIGETVQMELATGEVIDVEMMPDPRLIDTEGLTVFGGNDKWRITVYLGDLAELRKLASQS